MLQEMAQTTVLNNFRVRNSDAKQIANLDVVLAVRQSDCIPVSHMGLSAKDAQKSSGLEGAQEHGASTFPMKHWEPRSFFQFPNSPKLGFNHFIWGGRKTEEAFGDIF